MSAPQDYFFWDGLHSTTAANARLAAEIYAQVPEPASWLLLALGLALTGWGRRPALRAGLAAP